MSEDRRRLFPGVVFAAMVLITGAMGVAVVYRNAAALVVVIGLSIVLAVAVAVLGIRAPRRPNPNVAPSMQHLDADQRRLVIATAHSGARAPDPVLAEAVVAYARGQRAWLALILVAAAIGLGYRVFEVVAGTSRGLDNVALVGWLALAAFFAFRLMRALRAIAANRNAG